jgi:hypothetical protein
MTTPLKTAFERLSTEDYRVFEISTDGLFAHHQWLQTGEPVFIDTEEGRLLCAHGGRKGIKAPWEMQEEADMVTCCRPAYNPHLRDKLLFPDHTRNTWCTTVHVKHNSWLIEAKEKYMLDIIERELKPPKESPLPLPLKEGYHWREW